MIENHKENMEIKEIFT